MGMYKDFWPEEAHFRLKLLEGARSFWEQLIINVDQQCIVGLNTQHSRHTYLQRQKQN